MRRNCWMIPWLYLHCKGCIHNSAGLIVWPVMALGWFDLMKCMTKGVYAFCHDSAALQSHPFETSPFGAVLFCLLTVILHFGKLQVFPNAASSPSPFVSTIVNETALLSARWHPPLQTPAPPSLSPYGSSMKTVANLYFLNLYPCFTNTRQQTPREFTRRLNKSMMLFA